MPYTLRKVKNKKYKNNQKMHFILNNDTNKKEYEWRIKNLTSIYQNYIDTRDFIFNKILKIRSFFIHYMNGSPRFPAPEEHYHYIKRDHL
jgi:hypothetical protein